MVQKAHQWMQQNDFDFIITGEVMGQRPMSQRKKTLPVVSRESGADDLLLRPLCAKNLPETRPEKEGWVAREKLHGITGRSRKQQMALAQQYGFEDYAQPAGGCCFLTDQNYAVKLQDLWDNRGHKRYELDDIMLLKVGRHIRPSKAFKLIIAREEGETRFLSGYKKQFQSIKTVSHAGPLTLIEGEKLDAQQIELACSITARYSKGRDAESVEMVFSDRDKSSQHIHIRPLADIEQDWYIR
jgi:tRNA U34 2-thiouridine synthase MnmA/TrmU